MRAQFHPNKDRNPKMGSRIFSVLRLNFLFFLVCVRKINSFRGLPLSGTRFCPHSIFEFERFPLLLFCIANRIY